MIEQPMKVVAERGNMKRLLAIVTAVVLTGGAAVALATSAGGSPNTVAPARDRLLQVESRETSLDRVANTFTVTHDFFADGKKVGGDQVACFLTGSAPRALCQAVAVLPHGEITTQGSPAFAQPVGSSFSVAITGGTGAYRNARGTLFITQRTPTSASNVYRIIGATNP
jgi:hypothetical protein